MTFLHDRIGRREVKVEKLNDLISGVFRESKRIQVKYEKFGYKSILIGGMTGVTR